MMNILPFTFDQQTNNPLYSQIYQYIKSEITSGSFLPDTKIPSKRQLSARLQCSVNTVQAAYDQLAAEGYIASKPRSGYYVCRLDHILVLNKEIPRVTSGRDPRSDCLYHFSHHGVDLDSFPFSVWRKLTKNVINEYDTDLLTVGDPQGNLALRQVIANYLHHSRGVRCTPEQIVISSGIEYLFLLLIQLFQNKKNFAIESPGYEKLNLVFKNNDARHCTISLDEHGMVPKLLSDSKAEIACVTPSHQFPTGIIMPISRRLQLLSWANEEEGRYVIEDDYDSEYKYTGKPIPCIQGIDPNGKVIYLGAFSKSLTPAIRVSYMVLPTHLVGQYRDRLGFYLCPVPVIEQKVLCAFMGEGFFERHLNKTRKIYKEKRELLVATLRDLIPSVQILGSSAGLHVTLQIDNEMDEATLVGAAADKGVKVYGVSQYYFEDDPPQRRPTVLLGFATMRKADIADAVRSLKEAWTPLR